MKTHENEVLLVWRTTGGKILPTREYNQLARAYDAGLLDDKQYAAMQEQVLRQAAGL